MIAVPKFLFVRILSVAPIALLWVFSGLAQAGTLSLGVAEGFNVFVFGDVNLHRSDVEGRMAAGGNVTLSDFSIGALLPNSHGARDDLIAGGTVNWTRGRMNSGNIASGQAASLTQVGFYSGDDPNDPAQRSGSARVAQPIDFAAEERYLKDLSEDWGSLQSTGQVSLSQGRLTLTGTDPLFNVFEITTAQLNNTSAFRLNTPLGSTVMVNVSGARAVLADFGFFRYDETKRLYAQIPDNDPSTDFRHADELTNGVMFNFLDATRITMTRISVKGSILAPYAEVLFSNGHMDGQLIAESLSGRFCERGGPNCSGQFNNYPFSPIPIPAGVWLFVSAAAGLVGAGRARA